MAQENKQSLDEVIVAKISESSTLSAVRFTQACQVGVLFWGGQKKVYDKENGIDNFPPFFPNRSVIRDMYAEGLATINVLKEIEVQKAEEIGIIDRMMHQVRAQWTMEKLARIIQKRYEADMMPMDLVIKSDRSFEIAEGMFRRKF
jgi:hypothetical protein